MLLVLGFVGTVVALERAVALRHPAGFAAPAALGLGGLLLLSPAPLARGPGGAVSRRARDGGRVRPAVAQAARRRGPRPGLRRGAGRRRGAPVARGRRRPGAAARGWWASWCSPSAASASSSPGWRWGRAPGRRSSPLSAALVAGVVAALLWPARRLSAPRARAARPGGLARRARRRAADGQRPPGWPGSSPGACWPATAGSAVAGACWLLGGAAPDGPRVRRRRARRVPRLHHLDDHGACAGDPARGAAPAAALPPGDDRAGRPAARLARAAALGRRRPRSSPAPGRSAASSTSSPCCCSSASAAWSSARAAHGDGAS